MLKLLSCSTMLACLAFAQPGRPTASPFAGGLVTGAPYSAEEIVEMAPPASGSAQATPTSVTVHKFRDSAGRTRTERPANMGPEAMSGKENPTVIEIYDPVAGVRYTLDPQNKTARKQMIPPMARFGDPRMAAMMGSVPSMTPPPPPGGLGAPSQISIPGGTDSKMLKAEFATEKLGTKTFEGISAEGTRNTTTLPAGMQGGGPPVVTVSETWFSPELKVTMLSKENDPRLGERTTKLTNVNRGEPAEALFKLPSDYKIAE